MNEFLFIALQYPASYISTGIWFTVILPLIPGIDRYRGYSVVRVVDYLTKDSFYYISTYILYLFFLYYYTVVTKDLWHLYFGIQSWIGIAGMEIALQVSGKRKIQFSKSAYATGSYVLSLALQTLREGPVCFGLPALTIQGFLQDTRNDHPTILWLAILSTIIDFGGLTLLLFKGKARRPRTLGSTDVTGRRNILDTIFYRFAEWCVIVYVYQRYGSEFSSRHYWIIGVTLYRSIQLGYFFGMGTYYGHTYIDAGPGKKCDDTWFLNIVGVLFRTFESTLSGYPKTIALTILMDKAIQKYSQ
jgi:hypothetical protein